MDNGLPNTKKPDLILQKAGELSIKIYKVTKKFPREEMFGITSQTRRAALSVPLNVVEGFARQQRKEHRRFLEIAYGSLKETMYLIEFSNKLKYLSDGEKNTLWAGYDELARMLWSKIQTLRK